MLDEVIKKFVPTLDLVALHIRVGKRESMINPDYGLLLSP